MEFSPNTGKHGLEKTPYLDTFHAVKIRLIEGTLASNFISILRLRLTLCVIFQLLCGNIILEQTGLTNQPLG